MKELDSFTVERLEEITELKALSFPPSHHELAALARIALAAKRAEPVAWKWRGAVGDIWTQEKRKADFVKENCPELPVTELYTTPQLNSQVPLGSWIKCSDQMPESQQWGLVWAKWFNQQVLCWEDVGGQWTDFDGQSYSQDQITHWMPLQTAPEKPL